MRAVRTPPPYEDRLSGLMPDPKRLSAVCRSALARKGSRWLSFARTLSRARGRLAAADTLGFVESLYGGKFTAAEGGAFSWDKVYRTAGGGLFISETRLNVSVRPRFDLHLLNVADVRAGSEAPTPATTALSLLSLARVSDREQPRAARHGANIDSRSFQSSTAALQSFTTALYSFTTALYQTVSPLTFTLLQRQTHFGSPQTTTLLQASSERVGAAPSSSVQPSSAPPLSFPPSASATFAATTFAVPPSAHTWNVLPEASERLLPAFGYVSVRGGHARQAQGLEPARPLSGGERLMRVEGLVPGGRSMRGDAASTGAQTSRQPVAPSHTAFRLTSLDLRRPLIPAPRREFVSLLLKTTVPFIDAREIPSLKTAGDSSGAATARATDRGVAARRFETAHEAAERQTTVRTYASPTTRRQPGGAVEIRREFRSAETVREHSSAPTAAALGAGPHMLQVSSPASFLTRLSEAYLPALKQGAEGALHNTHALSGRAPALSLLRLGPHAAAQSGVREGSAAAYAPRLPEQTPRHETTQSWPTGTREVLSSLNTFVEHIQTTFAVTQTQAGNIYADSLTVFVRPAFESALRRGFGQARARRPDASGVAAQGRESSSGIFVRAVGPARPAPFAEFRREAPAREAVTRIPPERAPVVFSTRGFTTRGFSTEEAPGAATFHFASGLLRRSGGASTAGALTQTAATAMRLAAAGETARAARDAKEARASGGADALREARAARPEGMALELIRQRREDVLRLPQPGYVFTQPARAQLEERQVITKASREEIVEVVRKEVRTLAASAPAQNSAAAARADLAGIADEVYSTLVRRLLVEKERLGRA